MLALISKNKMNIYEINILELIDRYLEAVESLQEDKMDVASEFIEMAARLVQMKSYFLLPRSEETDRLREELTGLLVEYSMCKEIAAKLRVMADNVHTFVRKPIEIELDTDYKHRHETYELTAAMQSIQGRAVRKKQPSKERFEQIVQAPFVSVNSRIILVLRDIVRGKAASLKSLFSRKSSRSATVATFLAVLELMRAGRVLISGNETLSMNRATRRSREIAQEASTWN